MFEQIAHRARRARLGRIAAAERLERRRLLAAISWTGAADQMSWGIGGNWSTGAVPTATDDVTINTNGTINNDTTHAVHDLNFSAGTITGAGELDVNRTLNWTGGTMSGTGKTVVAAAGSLN